MFVHVYLRHVRTRRPVAKSVLLNLVIRNRNSDRGKPSLVLATASLIEFVFFYS
jgi:hypothetical protein